MKERNLRKSAWDKSYRNKDNYIFSPHEEVIRFVSKYIRKKTGLNEFIDMVDSLDPSNNKILDLGCGIGRHVIYCHEMGLDSYGIDLSDIAIQVAEKWATGKGMTGIKSRIMQGDFRKLPWDDAYFDFAISHGVLDSVPYEIARTACEELTRKMKTNGLFYCDLISGDDSSHAKEYNGEESITVKHEHDTIQSYFNIGKIDSLFNGLFDIIECILIRREEIHCRDYTSRYHLIMKKV